MESRPHPARFPERVLRSIARYVPAGAAVLDPMAGVGGIHQLRHMVLGGCWTLGVEIEPEWACADPRTLVGNALGLPFPDGFFDVVATSPCLAQQHRVLTDDLRWVPAGDVRVGDELLTFDEFAAGVGTASRRRWQRATVVRSVPLAVPCVRVVLANGDEVITTPHHPWLAWRYAYGGHHPEWVRSERLMGSLTSAPGRGHRRGLRQPWYVGRALDPWVTLRSYDAGWAAGMFDGEGSLSLGQHGSPKLVICQAEGSVIDQAETVLGDLGFGTSRIYRKDPPGRQPMVNLYVSGGFPGILRALGQLRPGRLLSKWEALDVSSRTVPFERVAVLAVEPAGVVDIQGIETSSGTYIGEGYLHHNTYGNRLSDHHIARDWCRRCEGLGYTLPGPTTCPNCKGGRYSDRNTYRHRLGRMPHAESSSVMAWGDAYRDFHKAAWSEAARVLRPGGQLILNLKNPVTPEGRVRYDLVGFHVLVASALGFTYEAMDKVVAHGYRNGANHEQRLGYEVVVVFALEESR